MYIPSHFEEKRIDVQHELIRQHAFGVLVTLDDKVIEANHLPFEIDAHAGEFGTLRTHVARSNPVWRTSSPGVDALVIFEGPSAYISPSWYPSKKETGKVVPTYNYMSVHAYGALRVIDDATWLRGLVTRLSDKYEQHQPAPWKVADAPDDYVEKLLSAIVGIEIPIAKMQGKWKLSQNRSGDDRHGVPTNLRALGTDAASAMASRID
jgi:transcriptional regulator